MKNFDLAIGQHPKFNNILKQIYQLTKKPLISSPSQILEVILCYPSVQLKVLSQHRVGCRNFLNNLIRFQVILCTVRVCSELLYTLEMSGLKDIFGSTINSNKIATISFLEEVRVDYFHLCVESTKNYGLTLQ